MGGVGFNKDHSLRGLYTVCWWSYACVCECVRCFVGSLQLAILSVQSIKQRQMNNWWFSTEIQTIQWISILKMTNLERGLGGQVISKQRLPVSPDIHSWVRCYIKTPKCKHTTHSTLTPASTHYCEESNHNCDGVQELTAHNFMSLHPTSSFRGGPGSHCLSPQSKASDWSDSD